MSRVDVLQYSDGCGGGNLSGKSATTKLEAGPSDEDALGDEDTWKWGDDPCNPYNWPTECKVYQVLMMASAAFTR